MFNCERCGRPAYEPERCGFCGRSLGRECFKSQKKLHRLVRVMICKDDWSDVEKRSKFKSAR